MTNIGMDVARVTSLPLSTRMQALLAHLVQAIDTRDALMCEATEAGPPDSNRVPHTCSECHGLGFVMTPVLGDGDEDNDDDDMPPLGSLTPPTSSPKLPNIDYEFEAAILQDREQHRHTVQAPSSSTASAIIPASSLSPTCSNLEPETVITSVLAAMAIAPAAAGMSVAVPDGSADTAGASQASQTSSVGTQPAVAASQPVVVASQPVVAASQPVHQANIVQPPPPMPTTVPGVSPIVPGYHPLGEHTPAPAPEDAVFAGPEDGPFYTVTRGLRVGVFGGWHTASPYVVGVGPAVFNKHPTLLSAYTAYFHAYYYRQSVKYN